MMKSLIGFIASSKWMGFAVGVVLKGSHNKFSSKQYRDLQAPVWEQVIWGEGRHNTVTYKRLYGNRLSEVKDDT